MYRVLIVDDEITFIQHILQFDWSSWNCKCVGTAMNGQDALRKCSELLPDIVITDINMPALDGITLMRHLNDLYPNIQIILLTVYRQFEFAQEAIRLNAIDYIIKDAAVTDHMSRAIQKAVAAAEASGNGRHSTEWLEQGRRLLRLDLLGDESLITQELADFAKHNNGTLLSCHLGTGAHALCGTIARNTPNEQSLPGMIVWNDHLLELIAPCPDYTARNWMLAFMETHAAPFADISMDISIDGPVCCAESYRKCHERTWNTLQDMFYRERTGKVVFARAEDVRIGSLPPAEAEEWIKTNDFEMINQEKIKDAVENLVCPRLTEIRCPPDQARALFGRWLRRLELRYAEQSLDDAHERIAHAASVYELKTRFVEAVDSLSRDRDCRSYAVRKAMDYISAKLGECDLKLNNVAQYVMMSPGYLSRKIKDETGLTFQDVLTRARMEYAVLLLRAGNRRIYDVGRQCGYSSYRSFVNAFCNYYGASPKKYPGVGKR